MTHVHILASVLAIPGSEPRVRAVLEEAVSPTRAEPGCLKYELFNVADDPCTFIFEELWSDSAALETHMKTQHIKALVAGLAGLLVQPPTIQELDPISTYG